MATKDTLKNIPDWIEKLSKLLDSSIRIPGTDYTIGLDPIISLIPGVGDFVSYLASATIVIGIAREGVSGKVLLKMLGNILLDLLIGMIPVLGSIFDFTFKANERNMNLIREHQEEGKHKGSGLWVILLVLGITIALIIFGFFLMIATVGFILSLFGD